MGVKIGDEVRLIGRVISIDRFSGNCTVLIDDKCHNIVNVSKEKLEKQDIDDGK